VPRHRGIYYRPRLDGKVAPPYEIPYLDSDGKRRWEIVHGNLDVAETRKAELRLRRHRGEPIRPSRQVFAEYATDWLPRQNVKQRTIEGYEWALRVHLIPYFGRRRLDQISAEDVARFIAQMRRNNLKGWTITSALRPLSIILAQAARRGQIPVNPMTQLERGERPKHDDQREKRILSLDEMQRLLANTAERQHRLLLELLLASGLRLGEALGLAVGDLDAKGSIIRVSKQLTREGARAGLKTAEARRSLDIPESLMKQLLELAEQHGSLFDPHALVFQSRNGTGLERKTCREALKRAAKAANLQLPHPTLHDLRHTHASMLIALGCSLADVQHRLGHRKPDTTLRIYTHQWSYHQSQRSTIGQQLATLFNSEPQTAPALAVAQIHAQSS
jgi:integrase